MTRESTSFQDAVIRQDDAPIPQDGPFGPNRFPLPVQRRFVIRRAATESIRLFERQNDPVQAAPLDQEMKSPQVLVPLSTYRPVPPKVIILQRWIGRVERLKNDTFVAVVSDATTPQNPPEQLELDLREVPRSDAALLAPGAAFYWTIGYEDTLDGQRRRVSTIRFVRQPKLDEAELNRIFDRADQVAALLQN